MTKNRTHKLGTLLLQEHMLGAAAHCVPLWQIGTVTSGLRCVVQFLYVVCYQQPVTGGSMCVCWAIWAVTDLPALVTPELPCNL
jgi:hypothetical protein